MARRYYSSTAVATTLSASANNSTASISVTALSGFPASTPWTAIIDPDTASEEVVTVTGVSGTTLTVTRGVDGTTASSHNAGAVFRHGVSARDFDEANDHVNDTTNDVHSQYVRKSLVDAKGDLVTATADNTPARLAAGSNGQMLMADSSATAGLRYVDPPANRNLIINGAMQVAQRGTSTASITGAGYYTADRWQAALASLGTWTQSIETDAPTGSGLRKSVKMLCTTAAASPASSAFGFIRQIFEGQDLQRIRKGTSDAQQVTLSFWVKANVTGTYVAELRDDDNTRGNSQTYTISASATWEKKTITFPADTTGAFDNDNAGSLQLVLWFGAGTQFTSGSLQTTWGTLTDANRAVGQTNLAAATNNYWQITGVQLEAGPVATPFEFEPYEATLRKCQRYYQKSYNQSLAPGSNTLDGGVSMNTQATNSFHYLPSVTFVTTMRAAPTVTIYSTSGTSAKIRNVTDSTDVNGLVLRAGENGFISYVNSVSIAANKDLGCSWVAEIEL